jgi:hypothetical protein
VLDDYIDWYRAGMAIAYACMDIYSVALWWFAVRRTGLRFFRLWLAVDIVYLLFSLLHVVITLSEEKLKWDVFGPHVFSNLAHTEYVARPFISLFGLIAATLMVRWAIRVNPREHATSTV